MMSTRQCLNCRRRFNPRPQNKDQRYCSEKKCQAARKRNWEKKKLKRDPDYLSNKHETQRKWRKNNKDYWRKYRKRKKEYTDSNRIKQRERNKKRDTINQLGGKIAKMDASILKKLFNLDRYEIEIVQKGVIAKTDVSILEILVISDVNKQIVCRLL